jgi:creatinine amidohydrolase
MRYDPERPHESRQDDHLPTGSGRPRAPRDEDVDSRRRNFAYLNWKQVDALPRESTLLVLPTAAIEQHGHHLPLATDTLINNLLLGRALEKLARGSAGLRAAARHYGKSNEHIGFPGTLSVSAATFMAVLRDLGASIASADFKKLVLYNTHGGNTSLIDVMARDLAR